MLPTTTYRTPDFLEAARRLGVDVTVASEKPSTLEGLNPEGLLTLNLRDPEAAARQAARFAARWPIDAVVGVDDDSAVSAAAVARALALPANPVEAAVAAVYKASMRQRLARAGVPQPAYRLFDRAEKPELVAGGVTYPCVLKPTYLAASRGVIRADDSSAFVAAWRRIERILDDPEVLAKGVAWSREILVEDYLAGPEVALEGLLRDGALTTLALFDKPDPLEGPYFEETIYVTPSRLPPDLQERIARTAAAAASAIGLVRGPIHAEQRLPGGEPAVIEVAGRSIGGLCSRTLRLGTGLSLEELILRDALALPIPPADPVRRAAGVMMIPIPKAGQLDEVAGIDEARRVAGIEDLVITAHIGERVAPPPEGWRYLGFLFSSAPTPEEAEDALRRAFALLHIRIRDSDQRLSRRMPR
jgi:biotin carboxylase